MKKRSDLSLLEVYRGSVGRELEQSVQRVQTFRAPPSRVRRPTGETQPSRPLPAGPRSRRSPATSLQSCEAETPRHPASQLPPPASQPGPVSARPPSTRLAETCAPRASIRRALQKGTRLLLDRSPSAACNSLIQPASHPFPCPEDCLTSSYTSAAQTRRAVPAVSKP